MNCYCGVGTSYESCCQPIHQDQSKAQTAEQLMRSRFSAFVLENRDYLLQSWHPQTRPKNIGFDEVPIYNKLEIVDCKLGTTADKIGKVEFIAHFSQDEKLGKLHEISRFKKHAGLWHYLDGKILQD